MTDKKSIAGIYGRLVDLSFENYIVETEEQSQALSDVQCFAQRIVAGENPGWMALVGKNGTGKTHLVAACANLVIQECGGHSVLYTTLTRMMRKIRSAFNFNSKVTEEHVISDFSLVQLLIVEELGLKQILTDWEQATLDDIMDNRWMGNFPTIITSNLSASALMKVLGERVESRFADIGRIVKFTWGDYRKKGR